MSNPPVPDSDYVPSTAQVRRSYDGQWDITSPHGPAAAAEFDRWLAAHDRKVWARGARDALNDAATDLRHLEVGDIPYFLDREAERHMAEADQNLNIQGGEAQ